MKTNRNPHLAFRLAASIRRSDYHAGNDHEDDDDFIFAAPQDYTRHCEFPRVTRP